jgi:branched-chain amino acid transport system substrate-binding protein
MRRIGHLRLVATGAVAALGIVACGGSSNNSTGSSASAQPATDLVIGDLQSLTGALSAVGVPASGSLKVAADEINKAGGFVVAGKRYTLKVQEVDTASQPQQTATGATQLLRDDSAKFIFGPSETITATAAQPVVTRGGALFFSTAYAMSDGLEANGISQVPWKYTFASGLGNDTSLKGGVDAVMQAHPDIKTAVSLWPSLATQDTSANSVKTYFENHSVTTTIYRYDINAKDFTPLLTRIKAQHPDIIFAGPSAGPLTIMAKQMVDLGDVTTYFFGSGAQASLAQKDAIGKPLPFDFMYLTPGGVDPNSGDAKSTAYLNQYTQVNGSVPAGGAGFTSFYYGPLKALVKAMEKAGTVTDVDKIAAALTQVSVPPITGTEQFGFTADHRAKIPLLVCDVKANGAGFNCTTAYPVK